MMVEVGETVTVLVRGHFRKVEVERSIIGFQGTVHVGVFVGTNDMLWFAESDVVRGTRLVADER